MADKNSSGGGSIATWIEANPTMAIGGGFVLLLLIAGYIMSKNKTPATTNPNGLSSTGDTSGLTNGLVYVPTSTTFSTYNDQSGASNFNNTTSSSSSTTTVNPPPILQPGPIPHPLPVPAPQPIPIPVPQPIKAPPPPQPAPPPAAKGLIWDQRYSIRGGETLTSIAASVTRSLRAQGMPGSQSVSWHDLYANNTGTINSVAAQHHNPIPGGPWNDIFPGETITVPRWG